MYEFKFDSSLAQDMSGSSSEEAGSDGGRSKRKRGSYMCSRCGAPKKGHTCKESSEVVQVQFSHYDADAKSFVPQDELIEKLQQENSQLKKSLKQFRKENDQLREKVKELTWQNQNKHNGSASHSPEASGKKVGAEASSNKKVKREESPDRQQEFSSVPHVNILQPGIVGHPSQVLIHPGVDLQTQGGPAIPQAQWATQEAMAPGIYPLPPLMPTGMPQWDPTNVQQQHHPVRSQHQLQPSRGWSTDWGTIFS